MNSASVGRARVIIIKNKFNKARPRMTLEGTINTRDARAADKLNKCTQSDNGIFSNSGVQRPATVLL